MVYRIYVEKKKEFAREAAGLLSEAAAFLGVSGITGVRVINRYDCEGISGELFEKCVSTVFSEPQVDTVYRELPEFSGRVFAVEYLPGQYDQRADSASQCIQIISKGERPAVRTAKIYVIEGDVSAVKQAIEAGSTMAIKKPAATGVLANPHPEIQRIVAISASRFKGKGSTGILDDHKMLGQDPPDFNIREQLKSRDET